MQFGSSRRRPPSNRRKRAARPLSLVLALFLMGALYTALIVVVVFAFTVSSALAGGRQGSG